MSYLVESTPLWVAIGLTIFWFVVLYVPYFLGLRSRWRAAFFWGAYMIGLPIALLATLTTALVVPEGLEGSILVAEMFYIGTVIAVNVGGFVCLLLHLTGFKFRKAQKQFQGWPYPEDIDERIDKLADELDGWEPWGETSA